MFTSGKTERDHIVLLTAFEAVAENFASKKIVFIYAGLTSTKLRMGRFCYGHGVAANLKLSHSISKFSLEIML